MEQDLREEVQKQDAALDAATQIIILIMPEQAEDWEEEADQPEDVDREEVSDEDHRNSKN